MTIEQIEKRLDDALMNGTEADVNYWRGYRDAVKAMQKEEPNEPLTLEDLRKMDGEPVWVKSKHFTGWGICCKPNFTVFGIVRNSQSDIAFYAADGHVYFAWTSNGYNERLGAKIYRRPPKED